MFSLRSQKGLSAIGWLFVISAFGFSLLVFSKLGPHYLDSRFVVSALKGLSEDPNFSRMGVSEIRRKLDNVFITNNIRGKPTESVKINKSSKGTIVTIEYEERIHFFANIDVVLTFKSYLDSNNPGSCCSPPQE